MIKDLLELYSRHKAIIYETGERCNADMAGPFFVSPNDVYWRAEVKIVFVGQETNEWSSECDIVAQMDTYRRFNLGEAYYSSPFWNVIRKFEIALAKSALSSAWLNLNRYDQEGGRPSWDNQLILSELDFLLTEELKLLAPNIVIFFTGPHYDERLVNLMKADCTSINNFPSRQLCKIQSDEIEALIFRTYHPKYLRLSGLEAGVIETICKESSYIITQS